MDVTTRDEAMATGPLKGFDVDVDINTKVKVEPMDHSDDVDSDEYLRSGDEAKEDSNHGEGEGEDEIAEDDFEIKTEVDSENDDDDDEQHQEKEYKPSTEEEESMSEDENRKNRVRKRKQRHQNVAKVKVNCQKSSKVRDDKEEEVNKKKKERNMTAEEKLNAKRARNAEAARRCRRRRKEEAEMLKKESGKVAPSPSKMGNLEPKNKEMAHYTTEEELKAKRARNAEYSRRLRQRRKEAAEKLPEEISKIVPLPPPRKKVELELKRKKERDKDRERKRLQRAQQLAQMTPEEIVTKNRELAQKKAMQRIEKQAKMTDEELAEKREGKRLAYLQKKAEWSDDYLKKKRERNNARNAKMSEEARNRKKEYGKKWRESWNEEQYKKHLEKVRQYYQRKWEKLKQQEPEKVEELRRYWRERGKGRRDLIRRKKAQGEEILKKRQYKREKVGTFDRVQYLRDRRARETPEERQKRLDQGKLNAAKRKLRMKLSEEGASAEQIEEELRKFEATFQPSTKSITRRPRKSENQEAHSILGGLLQSLPFSKQSPESPPPSTFIKGSEATGSGTQITTYNPDHQSSQEYQHEDSDANISVDGNVDSDSCDGQQAYRDQVDMDLDEFSNENVHSSNSSSFFEAPSSYLPLPATQTKPSSLEEGTIKETAVIEGKEALTIENPPPPAPDEGIIRTTTTTEVNLNPNIPKRRGRGRPRIHPINPHKKSLRQRPSLNPDTLVICDICGQSYVSLCRLQNHKRYYHHPHFIPATKSCDSCSAGPFRNPQDFYFNHWKKVHAQPPKNEEAIKPFICDECGATYKGQRGLDFHKESKHERKKFPCLLCKKEFLGRCSLNSHLLHYHNNEGRYYSCFRCEFKASFQDKLKSHVEKEHPSSYFPCEMCGNLKYTLADKLSHYKKCKNRAPSDTQAKLIKEEGTKGKTFNQILVNCEICEATLTLQSLCQHYLEIHEVINEPFQCQLCHKIFKRRQYWVGHLEVVHEVDIYSEEMKEKIRKYYVKDRSKLVIKSPEGGHQGGIPIFRRFRKERKRKGDGLRGGEGKESQTKRRPLRRRGYGDIEKEKRLVVPLVSLSAEQVQKWVTKKS